MCMYRERDRRIGIVYVYIYIYIERERESHDLAMLAPHPAITHWLVFLAGAGPIAGLQVEEVACVWIGPACSKEPRPT